MTANGDGSYTLSKYGTYRYSVTAEGYKDVKNVSYAPTGSEEKITAAVNMDKDVTVDSADQAAVDKVKEIFDKESGAIRTSYKNASNINALVEAKLKTGDYAAVNKADQVTVSVVSSDDTDWISTDGIIHYSTADTLNAYGLNSKTISVVLKFSLNGATAETAERRVVIGWDQKHFASKMKSEADQLTWDRIKGKNTSQTEVTSNLTLPQCMGTSLRTVWSTISWTSSKPDVISIQKPSIDSSLYAATGVLNQPVEDTEVTLTATFTANKSVMNEQVEKISDINTISVPFTVTVKGTGKPAPTEAELKAILNQYYKITDLVYYGTTTVIDPEACTGDIQLPRYTRIKDENGENVFNNKEITVTSDNDAVKINGYKANVDVFQPQDTTVNLTVSFTREGVTVSRVFPITIKKLTQEDLDKEVEMMNYAKAHYFDGIKGNNVSADKITENLHPFQEMYFDADGNAVWVYNISDLTDAGICADGYFDDPWEMEGAGYNKFRSSNNAVIQHENLVVIRPETPTEITITSWLSSERYGKYASSHPDNEALQKLYKQEVSVTVTVQPDSKVAEQLQTAIDHAQTLLDSVTEGTGAGQYPEGTRDKLQTAITEAKALLEREDAAETEIEQKVTEITALISTIQDSQNETEALVTVKINQEAGKGMDVSKMTVKAHTAANYGYSKPAAYKNRVTVLDVLAAWHSAQYKDAFKANPTDYLAVNNGFINKIYGIETYSIGICVNDQIPGSASVAEAVVSSGDSVSVFMYGDLKQYKDIYLYFENVPETIQAGEKLDLTLWGMHPMDYDEKGNLKPASVQKGYTVSAVDTNGNAIVSAITDENGKVSLTIPSGGTYQITVVKTPKDSTESAYILPKDIVMAIGKETESETETESVKHVHSFSTWKTVSAATVFSAERQERVCACGEKETRTVGTALTPSIKVNMTLIPLQVKQTTTKFKVSGLANGDSIVSYTSSNPKVFTVNKNGKIKAGKKKDHAVLTITLKSGLKKTVKVNVQKTAVKTKKIQGLSKTLTLKKGSSVKLKPVLKPLTSQQKLTYTSSNKKVVTVSSKGVVKAKKSGKVTITVKSGSKKVKIKVTVK